MEIRTATENDLSVIMRVVNDTVDLMREEGNDQWTEEYPHEDDFRNDIDNNALYIATVNDEMVGSITIDHIEGNNYNQVPWSYEHTPFFVIHRLLVNPKIRGAGIASELLSFAEIYAQEHDIYYLKTDTYALNVKAQNLFEKTGFQKVGKMCFSGKNNPFYCYEKQLH